MGKILRKFKINENEISKITNGLKEKKLTNIYAGRELYIVLKKTEKATESLIIRARKKLKTILPKDLLEELLYV